MERWETIKDHPDYEISNRMKVRKKKNGKILTPNKYCKYERVYVDGKYRYTARMSIDAFGRDF